MWSGHKEKTETESSFEKLTLEMSAFIMVLRFSWVGPSIAITLWLFIPVTENAPRKKKNTKSVQSREMGERDCQ